MTTLPLLAGADVKLSGKPLDAAVAAQILEVRVDLHLRLPDRCSLRLADPELDLVDRDSFPLGTELEVAFAGPAGSATSLFAGPVASLEPEFDPSGAVLVVRAYDRSHQLTRIRRTATYQQMSYPDIARKLAGTAGLTAGTIGSAGAPSTFVQQSNETDWEFLWRLADAIGFEVQVEGRKLHFREAGGSAEGTATKLTWGGQLLAFRPRVTAVQQVDDVTVRGWDPATQKAIEATAEASSATSIGIDRADAVSALGGGTVTLADRPVHTTAEATALAESVAGQLGETFAEAEGVAVGTPALKAGTKIEVEGVGQRFGGTYTISSAAHVLRTARGYETRFAVEGRAARSMLALSSATADGSWRNSVVIGIVTNNKDPDELGRIRVRYPVLGDDHEGWWARVTAPSAGTRRGLLMVPQVDDEVLLAFEHGDEQHPYVLGSVWNGLAKPQELVHADGSFALRSDKQVLVESAEAMSLTGDKDFTVSTVGNAKITTSERKGKGGEPPGKVTVDAKGDATVKAGAAAKVEAGTEGALTAKTEIKVKAGTQLALEGGGAISIKGATVQVQATAGPVKISGPQILLG
jgi:phage protein D